MYHKNFETRQLVCYGSCYGRCSVLIFFIVTHCVTRIIVVTEKFVTRLKDCYGNFRNFVTEVVTLI